MQVEYILRIIIAIVIIGILLSGCRSTGSVVDQSILDHQRQIAELEIRNQQLTDRLDKYDYIIGTSISRLEGIAGRAESMGSEIDNVIALFGQYQREVERFLANYNRLQDEIRGTQ